jgi:hypothetical protein
MSKRKPATASKRAQSNRKPVTARKRVAARAQRNKQQFVRSPKGSPFHLVAAGSTESPVEGHEATQQQGPSAENRARAVALEAMLQATLQDGFSQKMKDNGPKRQFDFSLVIQNLQAYQAKLLEVTQANMQFLFEFSQRLATIRSPFEFFAVIAEFTGRRIIMTQKDSKELAAFLRAAALGHVR